MQVTHKLLFSLPILFILGFGQSFAETTGEITEVVEPIHLQEEVEKDLSEMKKLIDDLVTEYIAYRTDVEFIGQKIQEEIIEGKKSQISSADVSFLFEATRVGDAYVGLLREIGNACGSIHSQVLSGNIDMYTNWTSMSLEDLVNGSIKLQLSKTIGLTVSGNLDFLDPMAIKKGFILKRPALFQGQKYRKVNERLSSRAKIIKAKLDQVLTMAMNEFGVVVFRFKEDFRGRVSLDFINGFEMNEKNPKLVDRVLITPTEKRPFMTDKAYREMVSHIGDYILKPEGFRVRTNEVGPLTKVGIVRKHEAEKKREERIRQAMEAKPKRK